MRISVSLFILFPLIYVLPGQAGESPFQNILYIGDSHSYGNFGKGVDAYLRTLGQKVTSIASCGSSPSNWISNSDRYKKTVCGFWRKDSAGKEIRVQNHAMSALPEELAQSKPDLTVIALGTNILASPENIQREKTAIEKMLSQVDNSGSRCIWIGPPDAGREAFKKNLERGVQEIRSLVEKHGCAFVDSSKLTSYPQNKADGIHYGPKDATEWAKKVNVEIEKSLPSLVKKSSSSSSSAQKVNSTEAQQ
jgi:hypothetical protein